MSNLKINVGKWNNIRQKLGMWFFFVPFFLILGILFYFLASSTPSVEGMVKIEATVVRIDTVQEATEDDAAIINTVIAYEYNDESFEYTLESYSQGREVGKVINVYINPDNPGIDVVDLESYIVFYFVIGGFAVFALLIIFLTSPVFRKKAKNANIHLDDDDIKTNGSKKEESDDKYYRNEDYVSEDGVKASSGDLSKTLYFTYDKRIPQGHVFQDVNKNPVYEIKSTNFHMLLPITYSFNNLKNGKQSAHKITNPTTISSGSGSTRSAVSVRYTIDGADIWEFLKSRDTYFKVDALTILKPVYTIYKSGEVIAKAKTTGVNLQDEEKGGIGALPSPGFYKVELNPNHMELIAIVMMLITRCSRS